MSKNQSISMFLLQTKIRQGIQSIQKNIHEDEAILLLGDSGVGKSTILNYLIGEHLKIKEIGLKTCLINDKLTRQNIIQIGHHKCSQTKVPLKIVHEGLAFYDCPGFNDNKSQQAEIANSFYYQRLLSLYEKTKLIVVIEQKYITESRAQLLPSLAKKLQTAFGSLQQVKTSTLLIVNKCSHESTFEEVETELKDLITTTNMFTQEQARYLNFIIENKQLCIFKQPRRSQIGKQVCQEQRITMLQKIAQLKYMNKTHIKNIISDTAKLAIRDYLDVLTQKSQKNLKQLLKKIENSILYAQTGLYQIKEQLQQLFKYKENMEYTKNFSPLYYFCVQRKIKCIQIDFLKQDIEIVEFFGKVYSKQKTETYYLNLLCLLFTRLSIVSHQIDTMIGNQKLDSQKKLRNLNKSQRQQTNPFKEGNKENILVFKATKRISKKGCGEKRISQNKVQNQIKEKTENIYNTNLPNRNPALTERIYK